jgi:hypothetical protein
MARNKKKHKRGDADDSDDGVPIELRPKKAKTRHSDSKSEKRKSGANLAPVDPRPREEQLVLLPPKTSKKASRKEKDPQDDAQPTVEPKAKADDPTVGVAKSVKKSKTTGTRLPDIDRIALTKNDTSIFIAFPRNALPRTASQIEAIESWLALSMACDESSGIVDVVPSAHSFVVCTYKDTYSREQALQRLIKDKSFRYKNAAVSLVITRFGERGVHSGPVVWTIPCGPFDLPEAVSDGLLHLSQQMDPRGLDALPDFTIKKVRKKLWGTSTFCV